MSNQGPQMFASRLPLEMPGTSLDVRSRLPLEMHGTSLDVRSRVMGLLSGLEPNK